MKDRIRVAIADDHGLVRQGFASMLADVEDMEVIASVSSGEEAVNIANEMQPDIFLMDIMMRGMTGIEAARWIKEQAPATKIIIISSEVNKDFIRDGIKSGICGYLPKDSDKDTLLKAIRSVMKGENHFSSEITALVFQDFYLKEKEGKGLPSRKTTELSPREEEVLKLIALGKTLKTIADELFLSVKTIETHKSHIQDKLGLANTAQLVKYAIEHGLIEIKQKK